MRLGAGFDPAVSLNACTLVIVGEVRPALWAPLFVKAWQGTARDPLDIRLNVGPEAAEIVRSRGLTSWRSDLFARADVVHVSRDAGLHAEFDEEGVLASFGPARLMIHRWLRDEPGDRLLLRSDDPDLDEQLGMIAKELASVLLKRSGGKAEIVIPTVGGQHGDRARALVRALRHARAGKEGAAFDPLAWSEANAQFRSSRSGPTPGREERGEDLFRHPRSR